MIYKAAYDVEQIMHLMHLMKIKNVNNFSLLLSAPPSTFAPETGNEPMLNPK